MYLVFYRFIFDTLIMFLLALCKRHSAYDRISQFKTLK